MSVLSAFNKTLDVFSASLVSMFPTDKDLKVFNQSRQLLAKTNPRKVCSLFHEYITVPYKSFIDTKDEAACFTQSEKDLTDNYDGEIPIMERLRAYWGVMSDESKANVWKFLQNLTKLSTMAHA